MYELLLWLVSFLFNIQPAVSYGATPQTDYVGVVAAEAAYSAAMPGSAPVKPKKPIDPNCKTCQGKGKIPSGDGLGWSPCPTCQSDDDTGAYGSTPAMRIQKPTRLPYQTN